MICFLSLFLFTSPFSFSLAVVIVTGTNLSCDSQHRDQSFVKKTVGYVLPLQSQVRFVTINSKYIALKQSAAIDYYSLHDLINVIYLVLHRIFLSNGIICSSMTESK